MGAGLALLVFSTAVPAIIGGVPDGPEPDSPGRRVDADRCDSPFAGVVGVLVGEGVFSGVLIADRWVLTAAHVAAGPREHPARITVRVPCADTRLAVDRIEVHPEFKGYEAGRINFDDLALLHLVRDAPAGVPRYPLFDRVPPLGTVLTLVGYGMGGDARRGAYVVAQADTRRVGENAMDILLPGSDGQPHGFVYDFDGADAASNMTGRGSLGNRREATVASGDSGSAALVFDNGRWALAGISTFQFRFPATPPRMSAAPGHFGSGGGGMLVAPYAGWLRSASGTYQPPR